MEQSLAVSTVAEKGAGLMGNKLQHSLIKYNECYFASVAFILFALQLVLPPSSMQMKKKVQKGGL